MFGVWVEGCYCVFQKVEVEFVLVSVFFGLLGLLIVVVICVDVLGLVVVDVVQIVVVFGKMVGMICQVLVMGQFDFLWVGFLVLWVFCLDGGVMFFLVCFVEVLVVGEFMFLLMELFGLFFFQVFVVMGVGILVMEGLVWFDFESDMLVVMVLFFDFQSDFWFWIGLFVGFVSGSVDFFFELFEIIIGVGVV